MPSANIDACLSLCIRSPPSFFWGENPYTRGVYGVFRLEVTECGGP